MWNLEILCEILKSQRKSGNLGILKSCTFFGCVLNPSSCTIALELNDGSLGHPCAAQDHVASYNSVMITSILQSNVGLYYSVLTVPCLNMGHYQHYWSNYTLSAVAYPGFEEGRCQINHARSARAKVLATPPNLDHAPHLCVLEDKLSWWATMQDV